MVRIELHFWYSDRSKTMLHRYTATFDTDGWLPTLIRLHADVTRRREQNRRRLNTLLKRWPEKRVAPYALSYADRFWSRLCNALSTVNRFVSGCAIIDAGDRDLVLRLDDDGRGLRGISARERIDDVARAMHSADMVELSLTGAKPLIYCTCH